MKRIKICYSDSDNMGDSINPYIIKNIFQMSPVNTTKHFCEITGIGSGLRRFFVKKDISPFQKRILLSVSNQFNQKPLILWSSGFLNTPTGNEIPLRKNMKVASVRGELSKQWVEKFLGKELDCTTGDAGLLVSEMMPKQVKKYKLGIIPHVNEQGEATYQKIHKSFPGSVIIDVRGNVMDRIKTIAQCECIISSSLHGLIFADSFHIPNCQIVLTDKLMGDGFKFADYYSCYGLKPNPINLNHVEKIDISDIADNYTITKEQVENKKSEIKEAFFKYP